MFKFQRHSDTHHAVARLSDIVRDESGEQLIIAGEEISLDEGTLLGHGIIEQNGKHYATICGYPQRANRLAFIEPASGKYIPNTGDVVIGRISEVGTSRWVVDIGAPLKARLTPQSISLETGEQRCKTDEELSDLRRFFQENDVVFVEVQRANADGSAHLHTRSTKYGKLEHGVLLSIPPQLIKRLINHAFIIANNVQVIIGVNGYIWVGAVNEKYGIDSFHNTINPTGDATILTDTTIFNISRVRNCILFLAKIQMIVSPECIERIYHSTLRLQLHSNEILQHQHFPKIIAASIP